jgi:hypothetical protein
VKSHSYWAGARSFRQAQNKFEYRLGRHFGCASTAVSNSFRYAEKKQVMDLSITCQFLFGRPAGLEYRQGGISTAPQPQARIL